MIKALLTLFLTLLFSSSAWSLDFSVMSFNTMCDFCHKDDADVFSKRKNLIRKVLEDHQSDIVALQEVRSGSQVKELFQNLPRYELFYTETALISYADPAIAVDKDKFEVLDKGNFWLGPDSGDFSVGWKFALPRQALWVKLKSIKEGKVFLFVSSHFDNRIENLLGAASMMQDFIANREEPVVFAGDTNLVPDFKGYSMLLGESLVNAFNIKEKYTVVGKPENESDQCYHRKGAKFPECRVDHILLSKGHGWKVKDWIIDVRRLGDNLRFPSDHRAVFSELSLE